MTLDECEQHFAAIRTSVDADDIRMHLRALFDVYTVLSFETSRGSVFWRGRKAGPKPYLNIAQISYPPSEIVGVGRLNDAGKPCLYAATRRSTIMAELGVAEGDHIQLVGFRVKPDQMIRIAVIGELFHVYKTGYIKSFGIDPGNAVSRIINAESLEKGLQILYVDAFLGNLLADPNAKDTNYLATRLVAALVYEDSDADGLFYPSIQDHVGMNVALLPKPFDSQTHPVCSQFVRVNKVREFGFFDYEILLEATDINVAGEFEWSAPKAQNITTFFGLTKSEHDFLMNKRMDPNAFLDLVKLH